MEITREQWAKDFLHAVGAPYSDANLHAVVSWMRAEGSNARYNPLCTTQDWPKATDFNWVGVKNYDSYYDGVAATAKTLNYGADHDLYGYHRIRRNLRNSARAKRTLRAVENSTWGTGGLALLCLKSTKKQWEYFSQLPIPSS
jgi:hypothetical protein